MKKTNSLLILFSFLVMGWNTILAQNAVPQKNTDGTYCFYVANLYFEVDPSYGSRISSFKLGDEEVLYGSKTSGDGYLWGSTFWQSPQSEWGWPPSVALDQGTYKGGIIGNTVSLLSAEDKNYNTHLTFRKTFRGNLSDTSITITYTIINNGTVGHSYSGWEITRVPSGGMAFFPLGSGSITGDFANQVQKVNNIGWWEYKGTEPTGKKYFSDGAEGWDGWLSDNDILYLRKFDDVPSNKQAPGEKEIELYFAGHSSYIELEIQSQYTLIAPKDSLVWDVKWFLRKLPIEVSGNLGSESLVEYARNLITQGSVDIKSKEVDPETILSVYPNPSSGIVTFQTQEPISSPTLITIYNMQGQIVFVNYMESNQTTFNLSKLSAGFYRYQVQLKEATIQSGKLLLSK
jgi:hypothetical protein